MCRVLDAASFVCRNMLAIVGDETDAFVYDTNTSRPAIQMPGHLDWSFAAAWHPNGTLLATGNQDCTTRVWDVRKPDTSLAILPATMGSIRACRFSADGSILAVAEPADFVHLYDAAGGFCNQQTIDFFGEVSGISFTPDSDMLYVATPDREYNSTLCYKRTKAANM
jgi:WD40 repeat protein